MKAQPRGTDGSLLSSLPWTLLALAVALLPHVPYLPIWVTAMFVACAGWRYTIERQRRLLPTRWVRGGLALLCFLGVLATYSAISGVGPGSALLATMAALKLLETRRRRDQFVLLFISIFLVMSSLLREQYIWSLPYLVFGVLTILTAWLRMSAGPSHSFRDSVRTSGRLMLYAAPLAIAMWVFFPRLSSPFWAVPIDTSQAVTGISDTMSPGDISSLSTSDAVAFRVQFDGAVPPARDRYWRGLVLTRFNGRTWTAWEPSGSRTALAAIDFRGEPYNYTVTIEPTRQQWIFALEMPARWSGMDGMRMGPQQQLSRVTPIEQRAAYNVVSYPDYELRPDLPSFYRSRSTYLPDDGNERTRQLALQMRDAAGSDAEYVGSVLRMFNEQDFYYTLRPPALGNNPVDRFVFNTRRGFCEHFASAFTYMMRAAGIPSRVVVGYQGGEVNPLGGHMIVRQSDAHAWSEVWTDERGWSRVDPTAAVAPERIEYGTRDPALGELAAAWGFAARSRFFHDLQMTWDMLNASWNDWVLGYGPEKQNAFMEKLGLEDPNWRSMMLTLIAVVIALVAVISGLLMLRYRAPPEDAAVRLFNEFVKRCGLPVRRGETALDYARRARANADVPAAQIASVTATYTELRYGSGTATTIDDLRAAVNAIQRQRAA